MLSSTTSPTRQAALLEIRLFDTQGKKSAPKEVRIFPFGKVPTSKGTLRFTERSARLVQKQWKILHRQFGFDFCHDTFDSAKPGADKIAAGWGDLVIKSDGLYVTNIEWTPQAAQKIKTKEFRYLSPACSDKGGEIVAVYNAALTNIPATYAAVPLVLSAAPHLRRRSLLGMADPKHEALARGMHKHLGGLINSAKEAGESDNEALKMYGGKLCDMLPEHYSALEAMMGEMGIDHAEPDGDEGEPEGEEAVALEAETALATEAQKQLTLLSDTVKSLCPGKEENLELSIKEAFQVLAAAQQVTGRTKGVVGALLALSDTAARSPKQDPAVQRAVDKGIKARKIHPADAPKFLGMSLDDVEAYVELAQPIDGPRVMADVDGKKQLDGSAPKEKQLLEAEKAAQIRASELLNVKFDIPEEAE